MSEEERRTSSLEVENICNVNDADTAVIVAVGMYKPWSQCFKRTIYFLHCFFLSSLWKTSCQFINTSNLRSKQKTKIKQTEKKKGGGVNRDESFPLFFTENIWK